MAAHPDDRNRSLVVVCGLPGSGKTTHARRLEHEIDAERLCPDEWMQALEERPITREEMEHWAAGIQVPDEEEMKLYDHALTLGECPSSEEAPCTQPRKPTG